MERSEAGRRLCSGGYSAHVSWRMAQRNLNCKDVDYIMRYGHSIHRAGALFIVLRGKDIPGQDRGDAARARLEGSVVVADPDSGSLITVYRNRREGPQSVRRKRRQGY